MEPAYSILIGEEVGREDEIRKKKLDRMRAGQLDLQRHKREFLRFFCQLVNK